ncbi:MAG: AAA family ATPase [bacterium]|nr:AAA family ATPase [bacterium]
MFLTKLEFMGFKSFAGKTALEFPRGIVAIVGPNGSGKSNVIDGIRWLLGERDVKNLRGGRNEDLIFAGTPTRARMGMAQASLHFDNRSKFFPLDYEEVSITRQVTRDGTSQYFLNKAEVRLKDIVDFFAHSRLGTKGLIIIGQGQSDLFIRATPQERREMIEEILGLREYQLKKSEAERKLKHTTENAEKAAATIEEIAPHLRLLKRQTMKWEKREEVATELRGLETAYFSRKIGTIKNELNDVRPRIAEAQRAQTAAEEELRGVHAQLKEAQAAHMPDQKALERLMTEEQELMATRAQLEKEAARSEAKLEYLEARQASDLLDAGTLAAALKDVQGKLAVALKGDADSLRETARAVLRIIEELWKSTPKQQSDTEARRLKEEAAILREKLMVSDAKLAALRGERQKLIENTQNVNTLLGEILSVFEKKKDEIGRLESEKNKRLFEEERLTLRLSDIRHEAEQVGRDFKDFEGVEAPPVDRNPEEVEKRMLRLRGELASIGDIDEALVREAKETEERHAFLTAQLEDLERAAADLRTLLNDLDQRLHLEFSRALTTINEEFQKFFQLMFGGGKARLKLKLPEPKTALTEDGEEELPVHEEEGEEDGLVQAGVEIEINLPRRKISGLEMLSGGERSLISIAALFSLISVSPPPFLVLDEIDAALDEHNARAFAELIKSFSLKTQFVIVTHNRATMEVADVLYGVTMAEDGASKIVSLKLSD